MKRSFRVTLEIPGDVTEEQMIEYIRVAVSSWCGGLAPYQELFYLDRKTVKVTRMQAYRPDRDRTGRKIRKEPAPISDANLSAYHGDIDGDFDY